MAEAAKSLTGYAAVNGTSFYYETAGSGAPLVLIHAGIADRRMWSGQMEAFARHFKTIRYDARGYGRTKMGTGRHSRSADLHGLLQALDLDQAILLGSSQGGTAALDFALEFPEMVRNLVLVSTVPSGYPLEGEPPPKLLQFLSAYQQLDSDRAAELATQVWFDGPGRSPEQVSPDLRGQVCDMMREVLAAGSLDLTEESLVERPAVDRLGEIRVPTLVITGDQDDLSVLAAGEFLASGILNADRAVIPGGAHLLNVEKAEEFNRAVLGFLQGQV